MLVTKTTGNTIDIQHLVFQCLTICLTSKYIQQREVFLNLNKTIFLLIQRFRHNGFVVLIILKDWIIICEGINLKGNINFLTEPDEIKELLYSIQHHTTHRTRPVQNKHQTMILTVCNSCNLTEQVFIVFVGVQFGAVQNPRASSCGTSITICCLTTLKLFYQVINFLLCRTFELTELFICLTKDFTRFIEPSIKIRFPRFFATIMNLSITYNNLFDIQFGNLNINILPTILIYKIFECIFQIINCLDFWFRSFTTRLTLCGFRITTTLVRIITKFTICITLTFLLVTKVRSRIATRTRLLIFVRIQIDFGFFLLLLLAILIKNLSSIQCLIKSFGITNLIDNILFFYCKIKGEEITNFKIKIGPVGKIIS